MTKQAKSHWNKTEKLMNMETADKQRGGEGRERQEEEEKPQTLTLGKGTKLDTISEYRETKRKKKERQEYNRPTKSHQEKIQTSIKMKITKKREGGRGRQKKEDKPSNITLEQDTNLNKNGGRKKMKRGRQKRKTKKGRQNK